MIEAADETHLDQEWSCYVNEGLSDVPYRKGTFQLLTEGFLTEGMRLPTYLLPQRYEVELIPVLEEGSFITLGRVSVELVAGADATGAEKSVVLHSKYTHVDEATVALVDMSTGEAAVISGHEYDLEREFYVIHLEDAINATSGPHNLSMTFQSQLLDDLRGLYYSTYYDEEEDETKYLAVTQFEAVDARRTFPCMDEPEFKATFALKLGRTADKVAASNMPIAYSIGNYSIDDGTRPEYMMDVFEETPVMSTYLVVVLVADFSTTEADTGFLETPFTIWHQPQLGYQTALAADVGPTVLQELERFYRVRFPLPKMDMAAIPDFDAGAMENWGLITYRETVLLFDPEESSIDDYETVVRVITHELAHQWFGDLVTMKWWDDLWLNEGR